MQERIKVKSKIEFVRRRADQAKTYANYLKVERQVIEVFGKGSEVHLDFLCATTEHREWLRKHASKDQKR